jgi:class 3 adenylate cyclase
MMPGLTRFEGDKEARFRTRYAERSIPFIRVSLPLAATLYLLFIAWDYSIDPGALLHTLSVRLPFSFFAVAVFGLTFLQSFERWSQGVLCATVILGAAGIVLVLAILPDGFTYGTPGLLLVIMYACGAIRLLLNAAAIACGAIIVLANAVLVYKGASAFQFLNTNVFLISASIIGLSYTTLLEWTERHAFALEEGLREDKKASEAMLRNFLPDRIMSRLREGERSIAEAVGEATVLFADVVGFTSLKTIGDCYMAVAGVRSQSPRSAEAMAEFAIEALAFVRAYAKDNDLPLQVRIGMSTGSLVSGVIGTHVPIFDLWGGPVNDASRLQQEGVPGTIQVGESTYWRLRNKYEFQERGTLTLKHGEQLNAYLLTGRKVAAGVGLRVISDLAREHNEQRSPQVV